MDIAKKVALVTGGAKRVGKSIALGLARKGADIVLHYRHSKEEAFATQREIKALGVHCHLLQADLSDPSHIQRMAQELAEHKISVDILVNSASIFYKTPIETVTEADWDAFMSANLKSYFLLSREIGLQMKQKGSGKMIQIADWSGFRPYKDYLPYCTSKGALLTMTKALARDLAPHVSVNAIAPGPVMKPDNLSEEENQQTLQKVPLGRWGTPEDISSTVIFLVENDFINGTVLVVDGGRSIV